VTSERHIQRCLPEEYKQQKKRRITEESTSGLRNSFANDDKNVPERKGMTVDTEGYEESFEEADRGPNVMSAAEFEFEIIEEECR
jgi:hypothetical protein